MPDIELNGAIEAVVGPIRTSLKALAAQEEINELDTSWIFSDGRVATITLTDDLTLGTSSAPLGLSLLRVIQDGTGGHQLNFSAFWTIIGEIDLAPNSESICYVMHLGKVVIGSPQPYVEIIKIDSGSATTTFSALTDTPSNYTGQDGKILAVNSLEDGLEFIAAPSGGSVTYATQTEAETGTADDVAMSPLRTVDAIKIFAGKDDSRTTVSSSGPGVLEWDLGTTKPIAYISLGGDYSLDIINPKIGVFTLIVEQDISGGHTLDMLTSLHGAYVMGTLNSGSNGMSLVKMTIYRVEDDSFSSDVLVDAVIEITSLTTFTAGGVTGG